MPMPPLMYKPRSITNARSRRRLMLGAAVAVPPFCTLFVAVWAFRAPPPTPEQQSLQIAEPSEAPRLREPLDAAAFSAVLWHTPPPPPPEPEQQPETQPVLAAAPPPPPPPPPPAIQLLAILTPSAAQGTPAESNRRLAIAYDPDADEIRTLRSGDDIGGGWSVDAVTDDAITLRQERRTVALTLEPEQAAASPQSATSRRGR